MKNILDQIMEAKKKEVEEKKFEILLQENKQHLKLYLVLLQIVQQ